MPAVPQIPGRHAQRVGAQRVACWLRRTIVVLAVVSGGWFFLQFGTRWVPAGMDTVPSIPPGSWCVVDRWCSGLRVGSDVFVETPLGEQLSRVVELRDDVVVIGHPNPNCGWLDSAAFGPLPRAQVQATVVVVFAPEGTTRGN